MSWGPITVADVPAESARDELYTTAMAYLERAATAGYEHMAETHQQIGVALDAAGELATSGMVGTGKLTLTISGHANPGHRPQAGWVNDTITVTVQNADTLADLAERDIRLAAEQAEDGAVPAVDPLPSAASSGSGDG